MDDAQEQDLRYQGYVKAYRLPSLSQGQGMSLEMEASTLTKPKRSSDR